MCIRIKDLTHSNQFDICSDKGIRILKFDEIDGGRDWKLTTVYEGSFPYGNIPDEILEHEVTCLTTTPDGWLEIEYTGDEYMGSA